MALTNRPGLGGPWGGALSGIKQPATGSWAGAFSGLKQPPKTGGWSGAVPKASGQRSARRRR